MLDSAKCVRRSGHRSVRRLGNLHRIALRSAAWLSPQLPHRLQPSARSAALGLRIRLLGTCSPSLDLLAYLLFRLVLEQLERLAHQKAGHIPWGHTGHRSAIPREACLLAMSFDPEAQAGGSDLDRDGFVDTRNMDVALDLLPCCENRHAASRTSSTLCMSRTPMET